MADEHLPLSDFLSHFNRDADDVILAIDFRVEVLSWNDWLTFRRSVLSDLATVKGTTMLTFLDTISVTRESILMKGAFLWLELPPPVNDLVTQAYKAEFSFEKPIPSLEVPAMEDTAHPKGAQYGESQPQ